MYITFLIIVQCILADNDDELDDDSLSLKELSRAALRPKISTEASKTGSTLQSLELPALYWARLQVNPTQSGSSERQGSSRGRCTGCLLTQKRAANYIQSDY